MPVIVYLLSEIKAPPDMYNAWLAADVVLDFQNDGVDNVGFAVGRQQHRVDKVQRRVGEKGTQRVKTKIGILKFKFLCAVLRSIS